jgi:hypothetical protein
MDRDIRENAEQMRLQWAEKRCNFVSGGGGVMIVFYHSAVLYRGHAVV